MMICELVNNKLLSQEDGALVAHSWEGRIVPWDVLMRRCWLCERYVDAYGSFINLARASYTMLV